MTYDGPQSCYHLHQGVVARRVELVLESLQQCVLHVSLKTRRQVLCHVHQVQRRVNNTAIGYIEGSIISIHAWGQNSKMLMRYIYIPTAGEVNLKCENKLGKNFQIYTVYCVEI